MTTQVLTIEENGKFTLPEDITERYQFKFAFGKCEIEFLYR